MKLFRYLWTFRYSLTATLLFNYCIAGILLFGALMLAMLTFNSGDFADLAAQEPSEELAYDIMEVLSINDQGEIRINNPDILSWAYDNLYGNLGFRIVDKNTNKIIKSSASDVAEIQTLLHYLPLDLSPGAIRLDSKLGPITGYRLQVTLQDRALYIDVARSDRLGEFAKEAVMPAIQASFKVMIFASVLLFILVSLVSLKLTTTKIKRVALDANKISPNQLDQRLSIDKIPNEIVPLANAVNRALARVEDGFEEQKRFVANAAHELRTPLTIIRTRIELSELPDDLITDLLQDVTYMSRSVEQLLDLSRAQNSSTYLHKPIPIVNPVTDACQLLGPLVLREDKDLELIVTGNKDSVIHGDHGALTVACKNIIENAIKHGGVNGLIRVEVGDNWIRFSDNGPGIDKKNQTIALQAFWRSNQSNNEGSGLGLAIVNEICKAHNATLTIERSISLKGAEITIQF